MEFTLTYRGPLSSNGGTKEKQILRRDFHRQLKELWTQRRLKDKVDGKGRPLYEELIEEVGPFRFLPLVSDRWSFTAGLNITFLRPGRPGQLLGTGGDIDNRIKTLLDGLTKPQANQIPNSDVPQSDENPFFCLLQDDALITGLSIKTDQWLDCQNEGHVLLLIQVETRCHLISMINHI